MCRYSTRLKCRQYVFADYTNCSGLVPMEFERNSIQTHITISPQCFDMAIDIIVITGHG